MANTHTGESGHDFERRGLTLARALHDPFGTQGAITYKGRERGRMFDRNDTIHAYEFTIDTKKLKATKDGEKLVELLAGLGREAEHRFKGRIGWFVTLNEPTADQRSEISRISKASGETVHAISISTMHQRICNSELYIQARNNAPFGSIEFGEAHKTNPPNVRCKPNRQLGRLVQRHTDGGKARRRQQGSPRGKLWSWQEPHTQGALHHTPQNALQERKADAFPRAYQPARLRWSTQPSRNP